MKEFSHIREEQIWGRRQRGAPIYEYYVDLFDRWMRLHGPEFAMPPHSPYAPEVRHEGFALLNSLSSQRGVHLAIKAIGATIRSEATLRAFEKYAYCAGFTDQKMVVVYIRGKRYCVLGKEKVRRLSEIFMLYAILRSASIFDDVMSGVGQVMAKREMIGEQK